MTPLLMGILNVTPDSFSGDGLSGAQAAARFAQLLAQGADIVDIGAESTRPGAAPLSVGQEWARLEPVLAALPEHRRARISIDTYHPETAAKVLALGVAIVNDVSGLRDGVMRGLLATQGCDIVVMHALSVPVDLSAMLPAAADPVAVIRAWKEEVTAAAEKSAIDPARLIYDPGIGFGKSAAQSLALIDRAGELVESGGRWLYGHSRKSFLNQLGTDRDALTLDISRRLAAAGVHILRVHDVAAHRRLFGVAA